MLQHFWGLDGHSYPEKIRPAPANIWNAYVGVVETKAVVDAQNLVKAYLSTKIPQPLYTDAENAELTRLNADIKTYRDEMFTGMIGGKTGMDQWDAYVNQMKKLGVPRVEEIHNTAYQRTYKR